MNARPLALAAAAVLALVWPAAAAARHPVPVRVIDDTVLGGYIEATAYVPSGPYGKHLLFSNGPTVFGTKVNGNPHHAVKPLFDTRALGWDVPPKGMAYMEAEHQFAFVEGGDPETLFVADKHGRPLAPRPIHYLDEPLNFLHNEELLYLPPGSPHFPDHLVMVANRFPEEPPFIDATLEIMRPDGTVVHQITPDAPLNESYLTAVTLSGPDHLLVATDDKIYTIDFAGHLVSGPVTGPGPFVEGLEALPDGRVAATNGNRVSVFDAELQRLPQDDINADIGLATLNFGVAWNPDAGDYILTSSPAATGDYFAPHDVIALDPSLSAAHTLFATDPAERDRMLSAIDYVPQEHLTAILLWRFAVDPPGQIALYNGQGQEVERIDVPVFLGGRSPSDMAFLPRTDQFALVYRGASRSQHIAIVSRDGQLVRHIDLAPLGVQEITSVAPAQDGFLIFASRSLDGARALVVDGTGQLLREFNWRDQLGLLGAVDLAAITSGRDAGAFAVSGGWPGFEFVTFRLG